MSVLSDLSNSTSNDSLYDPEYNTRIEEVYEKFEIHLPKFLYENFIL